MSDDPPRSRMAWPQPATSDADYAAMYRHKRRVHLLLGIAVLVLALAVATLTFFVYQQQLYIEGRGEYRDAEARRVETESKERIRRAMCDLLDTLPEGGLLDLPRAKYGCGPGIAIDDLPPEIRQELAEREARIQRPAPEPAPTSRPTPPGDDAHAAA